MVEIHLEVPPNLFVHCEMTQENTLGTTRSLVIMNKRKSGKEGEKEAFNLFQEFVDGGFKIKVTLIQKDMEFVDDG